MTDSSRDKTGPSPGAGATDPAAGWGRGVSLTVTPLPAGPGIARVAPVRPPPLTAAIPSAAPLTLRPPPAAPGGILGGSALPGGPAAARGLTFAGPAAFAGGASGRPAAPAPAPAPTPRYRATPAASPLSPPSGAGPAGSRRGPQGA